MNTQSVTEQITDWLEGKLEESGAKGFVVGVSGGVDSAVTSTLCALSNRNVHPVVLSIDSKPKETAVEHLTWLKRKFGNKVDNKNYFNLTSVFDEAFEVNEMLNEGKDEESINLAKANLQSRLRMAQLYYVANLKNYLVVGTGNKVEDFGVGFFTKYGDGGVDVSPIADLLKSEVKELGYYLGVSENILNATPSDGLWEDERSDEDQLGLSYEEIEDIMANGENANVSKEKWDRYWELHRKSRHKLETPPVCEVKK